MSVDRREVERIAALAHLRFDEEELERFTAEMNQILGHVESLRTLEAGGEAVSETPGGERASTRGAGGAPDASSFEPGEIAPRWADGFFVVPPPPGVQAEESEDGDHT